MRATKELTSCRKRFDALRRAVDACRWEAEALEPRVLLSAGPIFNFRFDQSPAFNYQSVTDSAGNTSGTFFGTNNGSADITNNGFPTVVPGANANTGTAWSFARNPTVTPAEIDVPNQGVVPTMGNVSTTTGLSIGFWVNGAYQTADNNATLMNSGSVDVSAVTVGSVGQMKIVLGSNQVTATTSIPSGTLDGTWHYVMLTADFTKTTGNVHLYVDGVLDPTNGTLSHSFSNFTDTYTSGNDLWIFSDRNKANHWVGAADDLVVYTRAVSPSEITELYSKGSDDAPNVFAGVPQTLAVNIPATLNGAAYDQGNVDYTSLTNTWSQVSGPGTIAFTKPSQLNTAATFPAIGTYVLQLSSTDGLYTATSTVAETVAANTAPVVTTTSTMPAIVLPTTTLGIGGTVTDDGLPYGTLKTKWSVTSSPVTGGGVSFANASAVNTVATFSAAGRYVLQLSASDGSLKTASPLTIEVYPAGTGGNRIVVDAGGSHDAWLASPTVNLTGSYWNTNNAVTPSWTVTQAPTGGLVTFGNSKSLNTTATFSIPGVYSLALNVTDGTLSGSDTSIVQVFSNGQNFSDSLGSLNQYFNTGANLDLSYDYTGFSWAGFTAPGAAYSHPRILISASDVPGLVSRLQNTTAGQLEFATIEASVANNLTNSTATYSAIYNDLANGIVTSFVAASRPFAVVGALAYDGFEQMILYEEASNGSAAQAAALAEGQKIGAALATIGTDTYTQVTTDNNADWQNANINFTYRDMLALGYDYDYNFMTAPQQNTVRGAIIAATSNQWSIGMDTLPSFNSNTSNWVPMIDSALLMNNTAVEGETFTDSAGAAHTEDSTIFPRLEAAFNKFYALGMFPDGEMYEGMGKGQQYAQALVVLAKRGDMLIAATSAKYNIQQLYSASIEPSGYGWTWDEYLGGSNMGAKDADVPVFAYAYPNDAVIDFQYRNALGQDYSNINLGSGSPNFGYTITADQLLIEATLAHDYNTSLTYAQAQALAGSQLSLTYTSNDRGVLITRSDWTSNAAQLYFQPRAEPGGHSVPDRDTFTYSAMGENWVPYIGDITTPQNASVVTVDGNGPSTMPAAVVATSDTPLATFMTGNAQQAYSTGQGGTGTAAQWNYNEFPENPGSYPIWGNLPVSQLPFWDTNGQNSGVTWTQGTQYIAAFRTAGIVRGVDPYALITDDIQEDNNSHQYTWQMAINDGVTYSVQTPTPAQPYYDIILSNPGAGTNLLVRMLSFSGSTPSISVSASQAAFTFNYKMLKFTTASVAPNFRVMLFAFKTGQALPTTTWNGNVLSVQTADGQSDQITYASANATNPTAMTLNRLASNTAQTLPAISIIATNPNANDATLATGVFTVSRTGSTANALVVRYTVGGTAVAGADYTALSGILTIPAGASSATISVSPINSGNFKSAATVIVTLGPSNTYVVAGTTAATASAATITIAGANAAASAALGAFTSVDIGSPAGAGSASVANGVFTVKGGGTGVGILNAGSTTSSADQFQFNYQTLSGNGSIAARVDSVADSNSGAKAGVMIRNDTTDPAAVFAYVEVDVNNYYHFIYRTTEGGTVTTDAVSFSEPGWVKLTRSGSSFTAFYSLDGAGWTSFGSATITMATPAFAGLAVTATNSSATNTALCTGTMDEVSINGNGVNASPTVSLSSDGNATESTAVVGGAVAVTRDNAHGDLMVSYTVSGTAVGGTDYATLPGTIIIPDGQNVAMIPVTPIGTAPAGASKSVIITLAASSGYAVGTASSSTVTLTEAGTKNAGLAPVVWYQMNQTPTRTANAIIDSTGDTTGTISSGTGTPSVVAGATSNTGTAWNFGTTGAGITVSGTSTNSFLQSLGNINRTTGLTIGFWVDLNYATNTDNNNSIVSFGKVFSAATQQDSTNHNYTIFSLGPVSERTLYTLDGSWHYIVMSANFESSVNNVTVYVDGVQASSGYPYNVYPSDSYNFADAFNDASNPNLVIASAYKGALDDFMIFNRPVSGQEVQTLYAQSDRPTAIVSVGTPPVSAPINNATISFDRNVTGLTTSALSLTRDGTSVPLTGATLSPSGSSSTTTYILSGLAALTSAQGNYVLTLTPSVAIVDGNNVPMTQPATATWAYFAAPTMLAATANGPGDISLTWTDATTDSTLPNIQVQRSPDGSSNWQTIATLAGSTMSYDDTSVADGTQYFYALEDVAGSNVSPSSNVASAIAPLLAPTISSAAQLANAAQVKLVWIDNSANATSVTVDRSADNGATWKNVSTLSGTGAIFIDTSVSAGATYIYRIQAQNSNAASSYVLTSPITIGSAVAPTVQVPASAARIVTTASTPLSVLGADAAGEPALIYTWATIGTPPAAVTFSINGSNAAKNTTALFTKVGNYSFVVTITDAGGLSATSTVNLIVVSTVASISVSPSSTRVSTGAAVQLTAVTSDQFGTVSPPPTLTWTATSGTVTAAGLFTAPTAQGLSVVTAAVGTISGSASITDLAVAAPLASYAFEDKSGTIATDSSGNGFNATLSGGAGFGSGVAIGGVTTGGLVLSNGSATIGNPTALNFTGAITLSAWIKPTSTGGIQSIIEHGYANSPNAEVFLRINNGSYQIGSWNGTNYLASATIPTSDLNTWVYLTGVYDPAQAKWLLYRDGVLDGSTSATVGAIAVNGNWTIGSTQVTSDRRYFNGSVDEARINNSALSATGVADLYDSYVGPGFAQPANLISSTATSAKLSALGAYAAGESSLKYTWYAIGTPPSNVTFNDAGDNTAKNVTATFAAPGTYHFEVIASDPDGNAAASEVDVNVLPAWLSPTSVATWNSNTNTLTVTGTATIVGDPGTTGIASEPLVVENGPTAALSISPAVSDQDIHLGGISLTNGATATVASVENADINGSPADHHGNHNVLVLGTPGNVTAPMFLIDSASSFNLEDNDLIYHAAAGDSPDGTTATSAAYQAVEGQVITGRNGGAWTGLGLTSSAAKAQNKIDGLESVQLGVVLNSDLQTRPSWTVGTATEALKSTDIILKYTYTGDFNLDGMVNQNDTSIFGLYFDNGATHGNEWAYGDTNSDGLLNTTDTSIFGLDFWNGTAKGVDSVQL